MEALMHAIRKVFKANDFNDDDIIDRLNHHFTVLFLIIAMVVVTTTQYVGSPINCWCPAYFTHSHIDFTNKVIAAVVARSVVCVSVCVGHTVSLVKLLWTMFFSAENCQWTVVC